MEISVIHTHRLENIQRKIRETAVETQQSFACFLFVCCMIERRKVGKELEHLEALTLAVNSIIAGRFSPVDLLIGAALEFTRA